MSDHIILEITHHERSAIALLKKRLEADYRLHHINPECLEKTAQDMANTLSHETDKIRFQSILKGHWNEHIEPNISTLPKEDVKLILSDINLFASGGSFTSWIYLLEQQLKHWPHAVFILYSAELSEKHKNDMDALLQRLPESDRSRIQLANKGKALNTALTEKGFLNATRPHSQSLPPVLNAKQHVQPNNPQVMSAPVRLLLPGKKIFNTACQITPPTPPTIVTQATEASAYLGSASSTTILLPGRPTNPSCGCFRFFKQLRKNKVAPLTGIPPNPNR